MNSWTMEDEIILVVSNNKWKYRKAYLVNPKDKNSLNNAKHWAGEDHEVVTTKNEGFELTITNSAGGSSQGGKLSFWDCTITKDDILVDIGINASVLCSLIKQSTFINGVCQQTVSLARMNSQQCAIHEGMTEYKECIDYLNLKKSRNTKKTTKYIVGHNYVTTTLNDLYLGQFYSPVIYDRGSSYSDTYLTLDFNNKNHVLISLMDDDKKCTSISKILNRQSTYQFIREQKKCPSRQQGSFYIEITPEELDESILQLKTKYHEGRNWWLSSLQNLSFSRTGILEDEAITYLKESLEDLKAEEAEGNLNRSYYYRYRGNIFVTYEGESKSFSLISEAFSFILDKIIEHNKELKGVE